MKNIFLFIAMAVFFLPAVHSQKTVIGTVDYSYSLTGEGSEAMAGMMPTKMVMQYGDNGMSVVMEGGMMAAMLGKIVVNGETGEVFMVKDAEKVVYLMDEEEIDGNAEELEGMDLKEADDTKKILGYTCKKYIQTVEAQGMTMKQIIWVTKELKTPDHTSKAFKGMGSTNPMNFNIDGFPMMVEIDMPGMPIKMVLEVSNIEFQKIKKSEFERPADYEVKPFSSIMQGFM